MVGRKEQKTKRKEGMMYEKGKERQNTWGREGREGWKGDSKLGPKDNDEGSKEGRT